MLPDLSMRIQTKHTASRVSEQGEGEVRKPPYEVNRNTHEEADTK